MASAQSVNDLPYKNPKLSPNKHAKDLLSRLSIEDKILQLMAVWSGHPYKFDDAFLQILQREEKY